MDEIKCETRKEFKPTKATGLIIGGYDIDMRLQLEFFKFLGIRDIIKPEFTRRGLDEAFKKITAESLIASVHPTRKLFYFVFYSGYGGAFSNGMTGIYLSSEVEEDRFYPFEK